MSLWPRRTIGAMRLVAAVFLIGATSARTFDQMPYLHAQRLVDIGARHMNLYCTGHGSPTVILDTDGHEGTFAWRYVQPFVARRTRVCSYDAAGFGFSDPAPLPRDANAFVHDVHALLARAHISPPLVLVGHQPSGLYDRLYADRYFSGIAGMVLVDPVGTHRGKRIGAVAPAFTPLVAEVQAFIHRCYAAAVAGDMRPGTKIFANCLIPPDGPPLPHTVALLNQRQWERKGTWKDYEAEESDELNSAEIEREQRPYGALPLIVLTSDTSALQLPLPRTQLIALTNARQIWHQQIAALSTRGTEFVISGSSDSIAIDDPASVISAIDEVVDQVRK